MRRFGDISRTGVLFFLKTAPQERFFLKTRTENKRDAVCETRS
jgi:hypothetical protein